MHLPRPLFARGQRPTHEVAAPSAAGVLTGVPPVVRKPRVSAQVLTLIHAGQYIEDIIAATGCSEYTVYRVAAEKGLSAHRRSHKRASATGTFPLIHRPSGKVKSAHYAFLPIPALRAAGLLDAQALAFKVEGSQIIITRSVVPGFLPVKAVPA